MNILICPNSFKECADSVTIADIIAEELRISTNHNLLIKPMTDGGDGFLKVCEIIYDIGELNLKNIKSYKDDLSFNKLKYSEKNKSVFLESAELFGMKNTPESDRNPMTLDTSLLGMILFDLSRFVRKNLLDIKSVWIGIGGTATMDFGLGACSQLGVELFNEQGVRLEPIPENFNRVSKINFSPHNLPFQINCVVDVETDLLAEPGALEIYGPQKGASPSDIREIRNGIENIIMRIKSELNFTIPDYINGAGGGLAAGLNIFFGANIISAKHFILSEILKDIDFNFVDTVITGEGKFDAQSLEGKSTGVLLDICKKYSIPLFLINGSSEIPAELNQSKHIHFINLTDFYNSKTESIEHFVEGIKRSTKLIMSQLNN